MGVSIAADMFAVVHIPRQHWQEVAQNFAGNIPPPPAAEITVFDGNQRQRVTYNRLCVRQAREAVYGRSSRKEDYLRESA